MQVSGLEINDSQVSILALKRRANSLRISGFAKKDLPPGVIQKGILLRPDSLVSILKELKNSAKPSKISSSYIIVALPEEIIYQTVKPFPNLETDQVRQALEINLRDYLPGKSDDIYWGWQEIKLQDKSKEVIIASSNQANINKYLESFTKAGLNPIALEPSSLAVTRAFKKPVSGMLISVEKSSATIVAMESGLVRFSNEISITDEGSFIREIKRSSDFYKSEKDLDKLPIYLAGNMANPTLGQKLADNLQSELILVQNELIFSESIIKSPAVIGAALRGMVDQKNDNNLSLLPVGTQEAYEEKRVLNYVGGLTRITVIICLLFLLMFYGGFFLLKYLNSKADMQLQSVSTSKIDPEVKLIQGKLLDINPKITYIKEILGNEFKTSTYLQTISSSVSEGIMLKNISIAEDHKTISIDGTAQSSEALGNFKTSLEKSNSFQKVDLSSSNISETNSSFTVKLTIKK